MYLEICYRLLMLYFLHIEKNCPSFYPNHCGYIIGLTRAA